MPQTNPSDLDALKGCCIISVEGLEKASDEVLITFETPEGETKLLTLYHRQDCCEWVRLESFEGDTDLAGLTVTYAGEVVSREDVDYGSQTKTFYTIACGSKTLVLRWYGESNGYYSESVDILLETLEPDAEEA